MSIFTTKKTTKEQLVNRWHNICEDGKTLTDKVVVFLKNKETPLPPDFNPKDLRYIRIINEDFSKIDLSEIDFSESTLTGCNFSNSNLKRTNFYKANLNKCEFFEADLSEANLSQCQAKSASFGQAILKSANGFSANMENASLIHADLSEGDFRAINLSQAHIRDANLHNSIFNKAVFRKCDLKGANVKGACFDHVDFRESYLIGITHSKEASWLGTDIRDIGFHGAYLIRRHIMDENYLFEFRSQSRFHEWVYQAWYITSDCGRSFLRWSFFVFIFMFGFAFLYSFVEIDYGPYHSWISPLYFSCITITTLGYGDVLPVSTAAKILAMIETTIGYCALCGLLSIFSTKMARRAE